MHSKGVSRFKQPSTHHISPSIASSIQVTSTNSRNSYSTTTPLSASKTASHTSLSHRHTLQSTRLPSSIHSTHLHSHTRTQRRFASSRKQQHAAPSLLEDAQLVGNQQGNWGIQDVLSFIKTQKISQCVVFDTVSSSPVCDYTVICTVASSKPMHSLIEKLVALGRMHKGHNYKNYSAGTDPDGLWAVADLSSITVHVLTPAGRSSPAFQRVERRLLSEARLIPFPQWDSLKDSHKIQAEDREEIEEWKGPGMPPPGYYIRPTRPPINPVEEPYTSDEQFDYLDLNEEHMNKMEMIKMGKYDHLQLDNSLLGYHTSSIDILPPVEVSDYEQGSRASRKGKKGNNSFVDIDDISAPYHDDDGDGDGHSDSDGKNHSHGDDDTDADYYGHRSKHTRRQPSMHHDQDELDPSDLTHILREFSEAEALSIGGENDYQQGYRTASESDHRHHHHHQHQQQDDDTSTIAKRRYEDSSHSTRLERNAGYFSMPNQSDQGTEFDDDDDDEELNALAYMKHGARGDDYHHPQQSTPRQAIHEANLAIGFGLDTDIERISDITAEDAAYQMKFDMSDRPSEEDYFPLASESEPHHFPASVNRASQTLTDTEASVFDSMAPPKKM